MSRTRRYSLIMLVVGMILIAALVSGCQGGKRGKPTLPTGNASVQPASPKDEKSEVTICGKDYRFVFPSEGPRVWAVDARNIRVNTGNKRLELSGADCRMYTDGRESLRVTAKSGQAVVEGKAIRVALTGDVNARSTARGGLRLTADRFHWNSADGTITATNVHWQGLGFDHRADKGTFTTDLTRASFTGHIRMSYSASE